MSKVFALGVAYASNTGGIATLVGTPPNIILQGIANEYVTLLLTNIYTSRLKLLKYTQRLDKILSMI